MSFGICTLSVIPCRKEPASTSEMVTQLLFGETYTIVKEGEDWIQITTDYDNYPCWISARQHTRISNDDFKSLVTNTLSSELVQVISNNANHSVFPLTIGASLPNFKYGKLKITDSEYLFEGQTVDSTVKKTVNDLKATAYLFLNAPYLWGGRSPFGIDCSGFTQLVYKLNGYKLPRDASQQVELGTPLSFVEEAEAGDLAFFDNEEGNIVHVGMVLENQQIIHASGCVRIDKFDHYGIFHSDNKKYSHMLRVIKKII
ncbi:MAG TPA: C40 family peptidase [Bacteroidia bacterium]|nr:C40 family peptidase [Bacteroidia bacterium]